jgi:hypothetical protein
MVDENIEHFVEGELASETEVLRGNLSQCHFVHHRFHVTGLESNQGHHGGKMATKRLSYGTAKL